MVRLILSASFFFFINSTFSQTVFFKSDLSFESSELEKYYSSLYVDDSNLIFVGNDYTIYSFNKVTGEKIWEKYARIKSNTAPFVSNGKVFVQGSPDYVALDLMTGELLDTLEVTNISTPPIVINDILYATGLYDGGIIFAYDIKNKKMLWRKFISHGCDTKPYYLQDRIIANFDGYDWMPLGYDGKMLLCADTAVDDTNDWIDETCREKFSFVTHDGKRVSEDKAKKLFGKSYVAPLEVRHSSTTTVVVDSDVTVLHVLGPKLKSLAKINLTEMLEGMVDENQFEILKIEGTKIWLRHIDQVLIFNYLDKSIFKSIDLSDWEPHSISVVKDEYWVVSKKDGLVYGIR